MVEECFRYVEEASVRWATIGSLPLIETACAESRRIITLRRMVIMRQSHHGDSLPEFWAVGDLETNAGASFCVGPASLCRPVQVKQARCPICAEAMLEIGPAPLALGLPSLPPGEEVFDPPSARPRRGSDEAESDPA